jgi:hypothetical protein
MKLLERVYAEQNAFSFYINLCLKNQANQESSLRSVCSQQSKFNIRAELGGTIANPYDLYWMWLT